MNILKANPADKFEALQNCRYFSGLPLTVYQMMAEEMELRKYERDEVLFWEGEPCAGLFILDQGMVKLFKLSPQGRELIVNLKEPGDIFNEVPVFDNGTNPINVSALQDCVVWTLRPETMQRVLDSHPEIGRSIMEKMCGQLRGLVQQMAELSFFQVTNRLARLLVDLPPEQLLGQVGERLTQDDLAARLGTVREVVARSLRQLERSGAIQTERGKISIVDIKILEGWAQTFRD